MWGDEQIRGRRRHWPDVDRLFAGLPPRLFEQAKLLQYDLALAYSETGQFADVFLGPEQFPLLSIVPWLLDDLKVRQDPRRDEFERRCFIASVLLACRAHVAQRVHDPGSFYSVEHLGLLQFLTEGVLGELAQAIPANAPFWTRRDPIGREALERDLEQRALQRGSVEPETLDRWLPPGWAPPATLLAVAAATLAQRDDTVPEVTTMLADLAAAFQIRADLASLHQDLQEGRRTYPIGAIARLAGIPLRPWPRPTVVLGAMVATGAAGTILAAAIARLRQAHRVARDLDLPTFAAFVHDVTGAFADRLESLSSGGSLPASGSGRQVPASPLIRLTQPVLEQAIAMAERSLLSDLTFKESWETHREGMFGSPEVASRFPAGMILEILCGAGHDLSGPVDAFLGFTEANGFRYFAHPWSDIDTDTIGVFLRLEPFATVPHGPHPRLAEVLSCLDREVRAAGSIPVWIRGPEAPGDERPRSLALGERCGTVAAHLLLGLATSRSKEHVATLATGVGALFDRIGDVGLGANVNYPRPYALAVFLRLATLIEHRDDGLAERAADCRHVLSAELTEARTASLVTAQDAALLTMASLEAGEPSLIEPGWIETVVKQQRFDGSWSAEPFAAAPNRGGSATWYSSTTLTSALCYNALTRYMAEERPGLGIDA